MSLQRSGVLIFADRVSELLDQVAQHHPRRVGPHAEQAQPAAELVVFAESGHCPMWEEPERFNQVVGDWIEALPA